MRTIIALIVLSSFLILKPQISSADGRDRHDRYYGKDRDYYSYKVERDRDYRWERDARHGKSWNKQHRPKKYWKKHRKHRHVVYVAPPKRVVYKPFMGQIVVREPVIYYPASYVTFGGPNLSFRVSW